jgi:hypothetical protein
MWDDGISAMEIAKALNVSKGAVIGAAHRYGWPARPSPIKRRGEVEAQQECSDAALAWIAEFDRVAKLNAERATALHA